MSRLKERYQKEVVPALAKEFGYKNVMAVPKIEKVVVNMGLGEATSNAQLVCPECGAQTRVGRKVLGDGRKVRVCRKCEGVVDK